MQCIIAYSHSCDEKWPLKTNNSFTYFDCLNLVERRMSAMLYHASFSFEGHMFIYLGTMNCSKVSRKMLAVTVIELPLLMIQIDL